MRRAARTTLLSTCLLLCAAACLARARSRSHQDVLLLHRGPHYVELSSVDGLITVEWETDRSPQVATTWRGRHRAPWWRTYGMWAAPARRIRRECTWWFLGFGGRQHTLVHLFTVTQGQAATDCRLLVVPWWAVLATFALPPSAAALAAYRRRRKRARGLCASCGYDLRASSGRCPECGAGIATATDR